MPTQREDKQGNRYFNAFDIHGKVIATFYLENEDDDALQQAINVQDLNGRRYEGVLKGQMVETGDCVRIRGARLSETKNVFNEDGYGHKTFVSGQRSETFPSEEPVIHLEFEALKGQQASLMKIPGFFILAKELTERIVEPWLIEKLLSGEIVVQKRLLTCIDQRARNELEVQAIPEQPGNDPVRVQFVVVKIMTPPEKACRLFCASCQSVIDYRHNLDCCGAPMQHCYDIRMVVQDAVSHQLKTIGYLSPFSAQGQLFKHLLPCNLAAAPEALTKLKKHYKLMTSMITCEGVLRWLPAPKERMWLLVDGCLP